VRASALAGRFAPRQALGAQEREDLERALGRDGAAASAASGGLAVAWTGGPATPTRGGALCLIDGRPRTDRLAELLALDPATPAEALLAAGWERLGDGVVAEIGGEFALVLWAGERGVVARDRLGARPLFVAQTRGALLFASEVRNLLALLPARPGPDAVAVSHWLARTIPPGQRTLYEGVSALAPGHMVVLDRDGWRSRPHWRPRHSPPRQLGAAEAAAELRAGLAQAVERSLEGAGRPAVMLSGGLDSAAVAAAARRLRPAAPPAAYSVVFPHDPAVDESARIGRVRGWLGLDWVEATFEGGTALAAAVEFLDEWELPSLSPNLFVWTPLLRRAADDGVDVMLDGEGGDELFGCARYLVADRLRAGRPLGALRVARRLPGMGARPRARWLGRALASYGLRPALPLRLHRGLRAARGRDRGPDWLGEAPERARRQTDDRWGWKRTGGPRWWAHLVDQLTGPHTSAAADQLRREGALAGITLRHPLRDARLIDLVLSLPPELGFDAHLDRPLARRALTGELPPDLLANDHKPTFNSLLTTALRETDRPALRALLAEPHPELAGRVRTGLLAALAEPRAAPAASRGWALDLWRLASLELWLRHQEDPGNVARTLEPIDRAPAVSFREPVQTRQPPAGSSPSRFD
jgi:asparagine synthase (glutamine-hydrolysing)